MTEWQDVNGPVANSDIDAVETLTDLEQFYKDQPHLNPNMGTLVTLVTASGINKQDADAEKPAFGGPSLSIFGSSLPTNPEELMALFTEMMNYLSVAEQFSFLGMPSIMEQLQALIQPMGATRTQLMSLNETQNLV